MSSWACISSLILFIRQSGKHAVYKGKGATISLLTFLSHRMDWIKKNKKLQNSIQSIVIWLQRYPRQQYFTATWSNRVALQHLIPVFPEGAKSDSPPCFCQAKCMTTRSRVTGGNQEVAAEVRNGCDDDVSRGQVFVILKRGWNHHRKNHYYYNHYYIKVITLISRKVSLTNGPGGSCVTVGNPKRRVPIGCSPPRTRVQKQDGFYISIIWRRSSVLSGYRFPATDSRCGSSWGCTCSFSFLFIFFVLQSITDGRLFQQYCAATTRQASSFGSANVQYCP